MAKEVKELKAYEALEISEKICDSIDATLTDIYKKIDEQARMGRLGMNYTAYIDSDFICDKIKQILNKKGYLVLHICDNDCIFSINIFWHGMPF